MSWKKTEIEQIAVSDDLHISPFRADGVTYGTPTWIWSVVVEGALYVRGYHGAKSTWYQAAKAQGAGRIRVAGKTIDVHFEPIDGVVNDAIDDAYRKKYSSSPYLKPMIGAGPRNATIRILPAA